MNNKTWYIHRTSRKRKCELYIVTSSKLFENDNAIFSTDESNGIKRTYFTREEAIKVRDIVNEKRKGKRYLWVVSNDVTKTHEGNNDTCEENTKNFKVDMEPAIPSHDAPTKEPTADEMLKELYYNKYLGYETPTTSVYIHKFNKKRIIFDKKYGDFSVSSIDNIPMFLNEAEQKAVIKKREEIKEHRKDFKEPYVLTADHMFRNLGYKCEFNACKGFEHLGHFEETDHYLYTYVTDPTYDKYIRVYSNGRFFCNKFITPSEHAAITKKFEEIKNDKK